MIPPSVKLRMPGRRPRELVTGAAADWTYAAGWMAVRALPESAARNAFGAGARYAARRGGPAQLRKNLARVIGVRPAQVPDSLMRESLESYARYWREAFRLPTMDLQELTRRLDAGTQGQDNLDGALAELQGGAQAGEIEGAVQWLVLAGEQAQGDLGGSAVVGDAQALAALIQNADGLAGLGFAAVSDVARIDPRMSGLDADLGLAADLD